MPRKDFITDQLAERRVTRGKNVIREENSIGQQFTVREDCSMIAMATVRRCSKLIEWISSCSSSSISFSSTGKKREREGCPDSQKVRIELFSSGNETSNSDPHTYISQHQSTSYHSDSTATFETLRSREYPLSLVF